MSVNYLIGYQGKDQSILPTLTVSAGQIEVIATKAKKPTSLQSKITAALAESNASQNIFLVRDLSLTGETKQEAFNRDSVLIDEQSGRNLALVYLNQGEGQTLDSEAKSGKVRDARFVNPESVEDVVSLDTECPSFNDDLSTLFERFDSWLRKGEGAYRDHRSELPSEGVAELTGEFFVDDEASPRDHAEAREVFG